MPVVRLSTVPAGAAFGLLSKKWKLRSIGGPKMAPAISPNKTWAGLGGAVAAGILALWGLSAVTVFHIPLHFMIFFGAVIALSGQAGDLLVSFLKRKAGVKDTGTLIPGHGGLLDRIDLRMNRHASHKNCSLTITLRFPGRYPPGRCWQEPFRPVDRSYSAQNGFQ